MRLQGVQVVVDRLARKPQACGERRGGGGLRQFREEPAPYGLESDRRSRLIVDDFYVEFERIRPVAAPGPVPTKR
jgi:hypothetical protein